MDNDPPEYESFRAGPFNFERKGRVISIRSLMGEKDKDILSQEMKRSHSEIKEEIDRIIQELANQLQKYDPRDFIESISISNCFYDIEAYSESEHDGLEAYAEYAFSLALAVPFCEPRPHPPKEELDQFSEKIKLLFPNIDWYFTTEDSNISHDTLHEFRYFSIMSSLILRGDSAEHHHIDLVKGLFEPHSDFFKKSIGFDINQILSFSSEISNQVCNQYNHQRLCIWKASELHKLFSEYSEQPENLSMSEEDLIKNFFAIEENKKKKNDIDSLKSTLLEDPFEIVANERLPVRFIELLAAPFGSNSQFLTDAKSGGWPTNPSIIYQHPITSYDGKYYSYIPQLLFRNIIEILEQWIAQADNSYYLKKYLPKKSEYLEQKSLEYFSKLLPNAQVFGKLYYTISEDGLIKNPETDGIIIYDDNLFIIEAKAGQFHPSARRGSIEKIKKDFEKLISDAYDQALRTKKYIFSTDKPIFKYKSGKIALEIEDTSRFKNIFLVNVTLENLNNLSTHLNSLRKYGLIEGREWPWSVFLNDFRTISELIDTPSEFLLYLQRRIRANDFPAFSAHDELDFLMVFFNEGLYFEDGHLDNVDLYKPIGYTDEIDRYYHWQMGLVSSGKKPTLKISPIYRDLIKTIEKTQKSGFTFVSTTLLSFHSKTQDEILNCIDRLSKRVEDDRKCHDSTLIFNDLKLGITLVIDSNDICNPVKYLKYSQLKKYQTHFDVWIVLFIKKSKNQVEKVDFEIIDNSWKYSFELEDILKKHPLAKDGAHPDVGRKIGRNELCPCGSGMKFKKCCGNVIKRKKSS